MVIVWDEPKRLKNLAKHGLDFADFDEGFDLPTALVLPAKNGRFKLLGWFQGELLTAVIVAPLGREAISLISMRHASKKEHQIYGDEA